MQQEPGLEPAKRGLNMKKLVLSSVMLLTVGSALAADLSMPPPYYPPPPPPLWTGPFLGASIGFGFGSSGNEVSGKDLNPDCTNAGVCPSAAATNVPGSQPSGLSFAGGAQLGYNFQFNPGFVGGGGVDFTALDRSGGTTITRAFPTGLAAYSQTATFTDSFKHDWLATARLKFGPTINDYLWIYGTGGVALGGLQSNSSSVTTWTYPNGSPYVAASGQGSSAGPALGYAVGAGAEFKVTPNLSIFGEYLYYSLSESYTVVVASNPNCCAGVGGTQSYGVKAKVDGNLVKLGLNYAFWTY
jgi:outer membrane immunogenic protein